MVRFARSELVGLSGLASKGGGALDQSRLRSLARAEGKLFDRLKDDDFRIGDRRFTQRNSQPDPANSGSSSPALLSLNE
jgi:hypothetical protein